MNRNDDVFRNGEPGQIAVGHAVAISRSSGGRVVRALASDSTRMPAIGIVSAIRGSAVFVRSRGAIRLPLSLISPDERVFTGVRYYVHGNTPGAYTKLKPSQGIVQTIALGRRLPRSVHVFISDASSAQDEDAANLTFASLDLSDQVDGVTTSFALPASMVEGSARMYWNGQRLLRGVDFVESGTATVELMFTPAAGTELEAEYGVEYGSALVYAMADLSDQVPPAGGVYVLPEKATDGTVRVYWNGQRLIWGKHFVETSGTSFTLTGISPQAGEIIEAGYEVDGVTSVQSRQADLSNQVGQNGGVFSLPTESVAGSMRVYWNGQRMIWGKDIIELSTTTFEFSPEIVPASGEIVEAEYTVTAS